MRQQERSATSAPCPKCNSAGICYVFYVGGSDPNGSMDVAYFVFFCPSCLFAERSENTGDWDHKCPYCGESFAPSSHLQLDTIDPGRALALLFGVSVEEVDAFAREISIKGADESV